MSSVEIVTGIARPGTAIDDNMRMVVAYVNGQVLFEEPVRLDDVGRVVGVLKTQVLVDVITAERRTVRETITRADGCVFYVLELRTKTHVRRGLEWIELPADGLAGVVGGLPLGLEDQRMQQYVAEEKRRFLEVPIHTERDIVYGTGTLALRCFNMGLEDKPENVAKALLKLGVVTEDGELSRELQDALIYVNAERVAIAKATCELQKPEVS
jgi:hypothetical protein